MAEENDASLLAPSTYAELDDDREEPVVEVIGL